MRRNSIDSEDRIRVLHILDACDSVLRFISGRRRENLDSDEMLLFALVRAMEIIGEAAGRVSERTRAAMPNVPWLQMAAMRNRLIHAYFDVNRDVVWRTASDEIPALVRALGHFREQT